MFPDRGYARIFMENHREIPERFFTYARIATGGGRLWFAIGFWISHIPGTAPGSAGGSTSGEP